jgi:uncharacterized protein (TIGR03086 family)
MFNRRAIRVGEAVSMTDELPLFPTAAPASFGDQAVTSARFASVLRDLARVVRIPAALADAATPCAGYTVAELQGHVLAWLQFFAEALTDPDGKTTRVDPSTWSLAEHDDPAAIVGRAGTQIGAAIAGGVAERVVVMSQARMAGDGVLAMALGEYLVHGWDLAVATGQPWPAATGTAEAACEDALAFLRPMVVPEYRGEESGFFGDEIEPPAGADAFTRLLCFAGRNPQWTPPATT